jgi:hypothetical protein
MGPSTRNFNVLLLGNSKWKLCHAYLQPMPNKTNVRLVFRPSTGVGRGLILAFFEGQRAALSRYGGTAAWLWNGGLDVGFSKDSQ